MRMDFKEKDDLVIQDTYISNGKIIKMNNENNKNKMESKERQLPLPFEG